MTRLHFILAAALLRFAFVAGGAESRSIVIAMSAPGEEKYTREFLSWTTAWEAAAATAKIAVTTIGKDAAPASREQLKAALSRESSGKEGELWLVLLGHGSWADQTGKFNVAGEDISAEELRALLSPIERPLIIVAGFAGSGGWLRTLAGENRIVVTATKSSSEDGYSRFAGYLSETIIDPAADFDRDNQTSLLEAWLEAARRTAALYEAEGRIATEHSLLEDNGDAAGTPSDWFKGVKVVKKSSAKAIADGFRAGQIHLVRSPAEAMLPEAIRKERDGLERSIATLRGTKPEMEEGEYYAQLEAFLLKLATLQQNSAGPQ